MTEQKRNTPDEQIALSMEQAAQPLGISRPVMLELTRKAGFPCFLVGRRILIPRQALTAWADTMASEGGDVVRLTHDRQITISVGEKAHALGLGITLKEINENSGE